MGDLTLGGAIDATTGTFSDVIDASAAGIKLGDTAAANLLNDYKAGQWVPVVSDATTGGNVATLSSYVGRFTKIGNLVTVRCAVANINTTGMTAGNGFHIQGLPYPALNLSNLYLPFSIMRSQITATDGSMLGYISPNTTTVSFVNDIAAVGGLSTAIVSQIASGSGDIYFEFSYETAS